jgi:hypothetical protein
MKGEGQQAPQSRMLQLFIPAPRSWEAKYPSSNRSVVKLPLDFPHAKYPYTALLLALDNVVILSSQLSCNYI